MNHRINTLHEYFQVYKKSVDQPEEFWGEIAKSFTWQEPWDKVLEWDFEGPNIKWFLNGKLNITENIFERNIAKLGDKPAIIWEPNDPNEKNVSLTYRELFDKTCQCANAMKSHGVGKGDRVMIYMPMVPEAAIAMLACARIGAIHSVVFAGFSSSSLADRTNDCKAKMILTSDGNFRGAKKIDVKPVVDEALEKCSTVETVIVLKRTGQDVKMTDGRDIWWHNVVDNQSTDQLPSASERLLNLIDTVDRMEAEFVQQQQAQAQAEAEAPAEAEDSTGESDEAAVTQVTPPLPTAQTNG